MKQEGEDCGECYCPPTYNAGTCTPGLICKYDDMIPDAAGTCVKPGKMWISHQYHTHKKYLKYLRQKDSNLNIFLLHVDDSKDCECKDSFLSPSYWTCIQKCNEHKSRTAIGSHGKYKNFYVLSIIKMFRT